MTRHDPTNRAGPARLRPAAASFTLIGTLVLAWAGLAAGAASADIPPTAMADLAAGLGWTVVISAAASVAVSAIYAVVAGIER